MPKFFSLNRMGGLVSHYFFSMKRNPARLIEIFVWPAFELTLFSFLAVTIDAAGNRVFALGVGILMGVLFWNFFARIIQETVAQFLDDAFSRNLQNLFIAPFSLLELAFSLLLVSFGKMMASFLVLGALASWLFPELFSLLGPPALLLVGQLVYFGSVMAILALALVLIFGERLSFVGWLLSTVIQVFSCVFYARSVLPPGLYQLSYLAPSSYVFEAMRLYLRGESVTLETVVVPFLLTSGYLVIFLLVFRWAYDYSRRQGTLTKM